jgi:hypothetical protein
MEIFEGKLWVSFPLNFHKNTNSYKGINYLNKVKRFKKNITDYISSQSQVFAHSLFSLYGQAGQEAWRFTRE